MQSIYSHSEKVGTMTPQEIVKAMGFSSIVPIENVSQYSDYFDYNGVTFWVTTQGYGVNKKYSICSGVSFGQLQEIGMTEWHYAKKRYDEGSTYVGNMNITPKTSIKRIYEFVIGNGWNYGYDLLKLARKMLADKHHRMLNLSQIQSALETEFAGTPKLRINVDHEKNNIRLSMEYKPHTYQSFTVSGNEFVSPGDGYSGFSFHYKKLRAILDIITSED